MAAYEVLLLNTVVPQIQAAQAGDSYVMVVNATTPALRITQTGTGDSILVEDAANPDSSPFVVTAAGNVGIGSTTPSSYGKLQIKQSGTAFNNGLAVTTSADDSSLFVFDSGLAWKFVAGYLSTGSYKPIVFTTSDIDRMTLDTSGNLGLGVAPSAWGLSGAKAAQVINASFWGYLNNAYVSANNYNDGTGNKYIATGFASRYEQSSGAHVWQTAPSGTAGNAITFTQAMTLDASGNLLVGATSGSKKLEVHTANGTETAILLNQSGVGAATLFVPASTNALAFGVFDGVSSVSERARITSGGDFQTSSGGSVQVGGTAARATTAGTNRVDIFDGTAPVGTLANGVSFYSAAGEANVMDAAGNATLLSPHDSETNEWIFRSKHTPTGKVLKIDVEKMLRFINDHFGLDAIHEFTEE
jgi:hypothetical protein